MSKIGGRAGHNERCRGAKAILDEVTENRPIFLASKQYLEKNNTFIDCTPYHNPIKQADDLNFGINKANQNKVDIFYSVHENKAYESFNGEIGAEVWVYDRNSTKAIEAATRILNNLKALGFKNRGIKYMKEENRQLAELTRTKMNALIVECFFLEATKDVEVYKRVGPDAVGFAIANGIDPSITKEALQPKQQQPTDKYGTVVVKDYLNIRADRGTQFTSIGKLYNGGKVKLLYLKDKWWSIDVPLSVSKTGVGFVHADYIKIN